MQTIRDLEKSRCTGCGVCTNACPNKCIYMKADDEGFLYPSVNISLCDGCNSCVGCCPVINSPIIPERQEDPQVYAAWSLDEEVRYNSTSGGVFTELARVVLNQNGYVAGARYNERHLVEHAMIDRVEDIPMLRQSKYVQSETKDIYRQIEVALQTGKPVLFSGTPCQCAGLKVYLKGQFFENLIVCDFICRGVNSPMVYLKYLYELELLYGSRIKQVWFKNKTYGWNNFCTKIVFENEEEYHGGRDTDPFLHGYIKKSLNLYLRTSCGQCEFKGIRRPVDITLGDFWGVTHLDSKDNVEDGVSILSVNTAKGNRYFKMCNDMIKYEKRQIEEVIPYNRCLFESAKINASSKREFFSLIKNGRSIYDAIKEISENDLE